jgi:ribosomal protein S17E
MRKDGLTYRLVPISNNTGFNTDWMVDKLKTKFGFGSADISGVYFDEENRRHLNTIRAAYADGAGALADANRKDEAKQLLDMADKGILQENMPYAMPSRSNQHNYFTFRFLEAAYKAGHTALADKVSKALHKDFDQQLKYYAQLPDRKQESMRNEIAGAQQLVQMLQMLENNYKQGSTVQPSIESGGVIGQPQDSSK